MTQNGLVLQNKILGPDLGRQFDLEAIKREGPEQQGCGKPPNTRAEVSKISGLGIETVGVVEISTGLEAGPEE